MTEDTFRIWLARAVLVVGVALLCDWLQHTFPWAGIEPIWITLERMGL